MPNLKWSYINSNGSRYSDKAQEPIMYSIFVFHLLIFDDSLGDVKKSSLTGTNSLMEIHLSCLFNSCAKSHTPIGTICQLMIGVILLWDTDPPPPLHTQGDKVKRIAT